MLMWQMFWVVLMLTELQLSLLQLASLLISAPFHAFVHFHHGTHFLDSETMKKKVILYSQLLWIFL